MYRFQHNTALDLTPYPEPPVTDRSGPPLSQGFLLTLISTVAADCCQPATLELLNRVDPNTWYHGQVIESLLDEFESRDATLPADIGKNVYYMLRSQFVAMGLQTPTDVITTLPMLWQHVTRGDSGEWRVAQISHGSARLELQQPYNCLFEEGALQGALEAFDAVDVHIDHGHCMRKGAPYCTFNVRWSE